MRNFLYAIIDLPQAEEGPKGASRSTQDPSASNSFADPSAGEAAHRAVEAVEGEREHPVLDDLPDHPDAGGAGPMFLRDRVEPYRARICVAPPAKPGFPRLLGPRLA